ncbi:hypothetical protein [Bradyrhizobium sp.]|uniref:hypothetical protein n=1 Tax=Bradyrhizobium sp. TaxID=376 RepID=UPI002D7129A9|nr:hypothetical protein [Bradyrhizobium sp.]HZR77348.1 hypothetical protein [Bradyrhizobium sp.]
MAVLGIIFSGLTSLATSAVTAYNKTKDVTITAIQSAVGIAASQAQAMSLWIGHPLSPPSILAYSVALYYSKAIAYDKVISFWITGHDGFTPPVTGATSYVAMTIISGMFFSGIANIIKR